MTSKSAHIHGGAPGAYFEKFGLTPRPIMDYSVNVSPLGPPRILLDQWQQVADAISVYPSIDGDGIADYYIQRFKLARGNILPGNGSTECIYLVPRVLGFKKVAIVTPSFHDYERSCQLAGAEIIEIPLSADNGFQEPSWETLTTAMDKADAIMMGNPNNPTNTAISENMILRLAEEFPDKFVLVDEAFIQFIDNYQQHTLIEPARIRKNILVFHSLTKFYDIPGVRLGCVIGHRDTIASLQRHKEPWTVNGIAEKVAGMLVDCGDYERELLRLMDIERSRLKTEVSAIEGITLFDSKTNYFLARWTATDDLDDLLKALLSDGIYIRDCRNFKHLENNFFRFTIRLADDNRRFIDQLTKISHSFTR